ncbi:MAG: hypothetical protein A2046_12575 [Bacteroidetes bacterium GWA2_30_7]|nr:MAG: hypothetical protein A2046_12575 [Bacteroidetes bacterium GWA2_30_7]
MDKNLKNSIIVERNTEIEGKVFEKKIIGGGFLIVMNDNNILNFRNVTKLKHINYMLIDWFLEEDDSISKKTKSDTIYIFRNNQKYHLF